MLRGAHVTTGDLIRLRGQIRGLQLPTNPAVYRTGGFRSLVFGRGMEYEKSRKYEAGDDVRMIDWRVTARTGTTHTKVFEEDRQKAVYLLVDFTESMRFGTQVAFKSVVAAQTAALLAWSAHSQGDLVSIVALTDERVSQGRLASSSEALIQQLDMLSKLSQSAVAGHSEATASIEDVLPVIAKKVRSGDLVVVLSDFTHLSETARKALTYLSHRQALIVCWIQDVIERQALPVGHYPVTDGLRFTALHVTSGGRRKKLQNVLDRQNQATEAVLARLGTAVVKLTGGDDVVKVLHRAFHQRVSRGSRRAGSVQNRLARGFGNSLTGSVRNS